jgi:hypothetical protein
MCTTNEVLKQAGFLGGDLNNFQEKNKEGQWKNIDPSCFFFILGSNHVTLFNRLHNISTI